MRSKPANPDRRNAGLRFPPDQLLFTIEETADVLRVGRTTIYALIRSGDLQPVHIGRCCRISRGELDRYVARLDASSRPPVPIHYHPEGSDSGEDRSYALGSPQDAA